VEDKRVPPHSDCDGVVAKGQAVRADEQAFRVREDPDAQHAEQVDEVAQISKKVVVASLVVRVNADRHEVEQLQRVPVMEPLWMRADEIPGDEYIKHAAYERYFLAPCDSLRVVPPLAQPLDALAHPLLVLVELLVGRGQSPAPFVHHTVFRVQSGRFEPLLLPPHFLGLGLDRSLNFLEALRQCEVFHEIEYGEALKWRKEEAIIGCIISVGAAIRERGMSREAWCWRRRGKTGHPALVRRRPVSH